MTPEQIAELIAKNFELSPRTLRLTFSYSWQTKEAKIKSVFVPEPTRVVDNEVVTQQIETAIKSHLNEAARKHAKEHFFGAGDGK